MVEGNVNGQQILATFPTSQTTKIADPSPSPLLSTKDSCFHGWWQCWHTVNQSPITMTLQAHCLWHWNKTIHQKTSAPSPPYIMVSLHIKDPLLSTQTFSSWRGFMVYDWRVFGHDVMSFLLLGGERHIMIFFYIVLFLWCSYYWQQCPSIGYVTIYYVLVDYSMLRYDVLSSATLWYAMTCHPASQLSMACIGMQRHVYFFPKHLFL